MIVVLALDGFDHAAVQILVDDEMAEPARGNNADAQIFRIRLDQFLQMPAELHAARRRHLVGRIIGVEQQRNDRKGSARQIRAVNVRVSMAFILLADQSADRANVELALAKSADEMQRKARMDWVVRIFVRLQAFHLRAAVPMIARRFAPRRVADGLAVIDGEGGHHRIGKQLVLIVARNDEDVEWCRVDLTFQLGNRFESALISGDHPVFGHHRIGMLRGCRQQFGVRTLRAAAVEQRHALIGFAKARNPIFTFCRQHDAVGGTESRNQSRHVCSFLSPSARDARQASLRTGQGSLPRLP